MLSTVNYHNRDDRIRFIEDGHIYLIDNGKGGVYKSVTTFIKTFFNPFNADLILNQMIKKGTFKTKYGDKTIDEIKNEWKMLGDEAAKLGTLLHASIENYYNKTPIEICDLIKIEYNYFNDFHTNHVIPLNLKPFRTEWYVFIEEFKIAGSIDMVYELPNGHLAIYDWKRSKKIERTNRTKAKNPINHLDDCNYYHYSLQLNLYKYILEHKYDKIVDNLCLIILHPTNLSYQLITVPNLQKEIILMLNTIYQ